MFNKSRCVVVGKGLFDYHNHSLNIKMSLTLLNFEFFSSFNFDYTQHNQQMKYFLLYEFDFFSRRQLRSNNHLRFVRIENELKLVSSIT
jgi:hypothetical protein